MLPKSHRLTRAVFPKYTDPKKVWVGSALRIQVTHTKSNDPARFAVVISKKISVLAVKRNQLRRIIFAFIAKYQETFYKYQGTKFVFLPLKKDGKVATSLFEEDIKKFLMQLL